MEEYTTPGTAGLAQRISSDYATEGRIEETSGLFALVRNKVMDCNGHNQY